MQLNGWSQDLEKCTFSFFDLLQEPTPELSTLYLLETLSSEVFIQPFYVAVPSLNSRREISRPDREYHTAMKAVIEVIECDFHASIL